MNQEQLIESRMQIINDEIDEMESDLKLLYAELSDLDESLYQLRKKNERAE